jgi:prophage regulatory protein
MTIERHIRRPEVQHLTGLGRSTIYSLIGKGEFPRPVKLTAKAVGWPESEIAKWLASRNKVAG